MTKHQKERLFHFTISITEYPDGVLVDHGTFMFDAPDAFVIADRVRRLMQQIERET
jgi:hypothetical protein